ncbi:hypothetical protein CARUB_v10006086mg [Capsella rubella]|uniref:Uncharacterized protein n=1 Tax=Capsella rubella TaxID=81985 RepID=R0F202_9BRAS|nr:hypothetical protein CARUB_v10006086mg [Capsella rubella]
MSFECSSAELMANSASELTATDIPWQSTLTAISASFSAAIIFSSSTLSASTSSMLSGPEYFLEPSVTGDGSSLSCLAYTAPIPEAKKSSLSTTGFSFNPLSNLDH